jgi:2'-hydroxyisoflavone reductase
MSQNTTRRTFLSHAGAGAAAATLAPGLFAAEAQEEGAPKRRLLMLGGTAFLGPQIVEQALAAGWEVTLFNRGKTRSDLFPDLDKRVGDRNTGDYASLAEGEWDVCIDTSCYIPGHVAAAIESIKGRVKHYVVVSTISVYAQDAGENGPVGEDGKIGQIPEELLPDFKVIRDIGKHGSQYYGALKALCEKAAQDAMPEGAVTVVRPGLIVGPGDTSDRYTYWPVRIAKGGEVIAPGDPDVGVQYVDVRDLGVFTFDVAARRTGKIYNAVGFDEKVTMKDLIESCIPEGHGKPEDLKITWIEDQFLLDQGVGQWMELPLWIAGGGDHYLNAAAIEDGHKFRDLKETAVATVRWHQETRGEDHQWRAGMKAEKEAKVLAAWHARD